MTAAARAPTDGPAAPADVAAQGGALVPCGRVGRVAGPVITVDGQEGLRLHGVVRVGPLRLLGEVIRLHGTSAIAQIHEETTGLRVGDEVWRAEGSLDIALGPGLLGSIYDGLGRPLQRLAGPDPLRPERPWLDRGAHAPTLDPAREWQFVPAVAEGDTVVPGDLLGTVREGPIDHRVLVPEGKQGTVTRLRKGVVKVTEQVALVGEQPVSLSHRWPVRRPRPFRTRLDPTVPLLTGQRVIDTLLPIARGGSATIPGGFGTGKTVTQQSLAKWADADVVVYIACGERGNELSELLTELPALRDPRSGAGLIERTVIIANTSNMPVAAREASVYTGLTIAEYYRDQGRDVVVLADSTSRWAEALREVSGRLGEMPGEEGYPAYLPSRLADLYERAGRVETLGRSPRRGSVSVIAAVSPPGGDFSEPVTQYSLRLAGTFWALDPRLARRRHFPAIDVTRSYSLYSTQGWFEEEVASGWEEQRRWAIALLGREEELLATVQLLGADTLGPADRVLLATGKRLRESFLQQSAFEDVDACCAPSKQYWMLWALRQMHEASERALGRGVPVERLERPAVAAEVVHMRRWPPAEADQRAKALVERFEKEVGSP